MSVSMEGPAWLGVSEADGSDGLPLGQVAGLRLHASHATAPLLTRVGLEFTGERCTWLQGTDPHGGGPILLAAPQAGRVAPGL